MSISVERMQQLLELREELKKRCLEVNDKYSLTPTEPHLDMPPSLNLVKLEFTPKTESELREIAEQAVAAVIASKQRSVDKTYSDAVKSVSEQKSKTSLKADENNRAALTQYNNEKAVVERRVIDNGLYFSNVANRYNNEALQRYNNKVKELSDSLNAELAILDSKQAAAEEQYDQMCESLQEEKDARVEEKLAKLRDDEEKQRIAIEKYNNSLEEKEQRYQYSKAKTYEAAYRAQQNKALQNAKIFAELGESGYRELVQSEKYSICIDGFTPLTRAEGNAMISIDAFFRTELGTYYDTFVNWINTVLPNI